MASLKVGVRRYNHSPTAKWVVSYRDGERRKREFFASKAEATTRSEQLKIELRNLGTKALAIKDTLRFEAVECAEKLQPFGRTLTEAVDHFIAHLKTTERSSNVRDIVAEYIDSKRSRGRSKRHLQDLESRLKRFSEFFGDEMVSEISTSRIDQWLIGLGLAAQSTNNFRTVLNALFNYGTKRGYLNENPIGGIERHTTREVPPSVLMPKELRALLKACGHDLLPYLAIGAFAGLRTAELDRLDWGEVRLEEGYIEVSAEKAKSGQRRFVDITSNLAEWLRGHVKEEGKVAPVNCRKLFEAAWRSVFPDRQRKNDLRHSYASYHVALHKNSAMTATQLGHRNTTVLFNHYRELVTSRDATSYFNICPSKSENVVSMPVERSA